MRIIRFLDSAGIEQYGLHLASDPNAITQAYPLPIQSQNDLFNLGKPERKQLEAETSLTPPIQVQKLLAPVQPINIFCIGLNYQAHAREMGRELPQYPVVFMKPTSSVTHPETPIRLPACATRGPETDYEVELAVIIGKDCKDVSVADALEYVFGYCLANDVSARRWQKHAGGGQWIRGKGFDGFLPLGPVIVSSELDDDFNHISGIKDPQAIELKTVLQSESELEQMQYSSTADMIFSVAQIISYLSQDTTLLAGTLISTGTPPGVGMAKSPPRFLLPGDEVTVSSSLLGSLRNPVISTDQSESLNSGGF